MATKDSGRIRAGMPRFATPKDSIPDHSGPLARMGIRNQSGGPFRHRARRTVDVRRGAQGPSPAHGRARLRSRPPGRRVSTPGEDRRAGPWRRAAGRAARAGRAAAAAPRDPMTEPEIAVAREQAIQDQPRDRTRHDIFAGADAVEGMNPMQPLRCGARTRRGRRCQAWPVRGVGVAVFTEADQQARARRKGWSGAAAPGGFMVGIPGRPGRLELLPACCGLRRRPSAEQPFDGSRRRRDGRRVESWPRPRRGSGSPRPLRVA